MLQEYPENNFGGFAKKFSRICWNAKFFNLLHLCFLGLRAPCYLSTLLWFSHKFVHKKKTWKLYYLLTIFSLTFFSLLNVVAFSSYLLSCVQNFPSTEKCEYFFPFCNFLCSSSIHARFLKIMTNQTLILFSVKITNLFFKHIVSERWFEICKLLCNP